MLESVAHWIISIISSLGYPGIILTMAIESALIPLPSEVIMPFSGYLVSTGRFNLYLVAASGAFGNLIGSLIAYGIGFWGHERIVRRLIRRLGKWILVSEKELDQAENMLHRYKNLVVLVSRVLPGARTVISLPCGIARLPLGQFILLTFIGSFIWSYLLAWIGLYLGKNWDRLGPVFHQVEALIVALTVIAVGYYIYHRLKK